MLLQKSKKPGHPSQKSKKKGEKKGKMNDERIEDRLDAIERKLDKVLAMLSPVHSHAEWVDGLRARLHGLGLVRNTPRIGNE